MIIHPDTQWQRGEWHLIPHGDPVPHVALISCWCKPCQIACDYVLGSLSKTEWGHYDSRYDEEGNPKT